MLIKHTLTASSRSKGPTLIPRGAAHARLSSEIELNPKPARLRFRAQHTETLFERRDERISDAHQATVPSTCDALVAVPSRSKAHPSSSSSHRHEARQGDRGAVQEDPDLCFVDWKETRQLHLSWKRCNRELALLVRCGGACTCWTVRQMEKGVGLGDIAYTWTRTWEILRL